MRIPSSPENAPLVIAVTGKPAMTGRHARRLILDDGVLHRPNGRFIVGNVPVIGADGRIAIHTEYDDDGHVVEKRILTRRHRFRIPKGHPWRGRRA